MQVLFKGFIVCKQVSNQDQVDDLKIQICDKEGIPTSQQRIIYNKQQIQDGRKLSDYYVQPNSIMYLVLRLRGGGGESRIF